MMELVATWHVVARGHQSQANIVITNRGGSLRLRRTGLEVTAVGLAVMRKVFALDAQFLEDLMTPKVRREVFTNLEIAPSPARSLRPYASALCVMAYYSG